MNPDGLVLDEFSDIDESILDDIVVMPPLDTTWHYFPTKQSFYRRHEAAIWITVVAALLAVFIFTLSNPNILWDLSTPLIKYMP